MRPKERKVFSENFKREQVSRIEKGEITVTQLGRILGMNSPNPIYQWLKKYGKEPLTQKVVIESQSDFIRLKEVEKQLKEAQQLIGMQQIQLQFYEGIIEEVGAHYGEDPLKNFLKK